VGDNANLLVGSAAGGADGTGLAFFAPSGSAAPTNATGALDAAYLNAGLITEDGITASFSEDSTEIRAYGTQVSQRTVITGQTTTFQLTFLESNETSLAIYHRKALGSITPAVSTGAFSLTTGTFTRQLYSAVFEIVDGTNKIRAYAPSVEVTNRGDMQVSAGNPVQYEVTLTAYPVSGVSINWFYAVPNLG
jgi:hypothetical protein